MKTKSIPCCVLGLIFSIIGALCAYVFDVLIIVLSLVIKQNVFILLIPYASIGLYVISFISAFICLFNAKISGIITTISSIINIILFVVLLGWLKVYEIFIIAILLGLPSIILLIIGLSAIRKHNKQKKSPKI